MQLYNDLGDVLRLLCSYAAKQIIFEGFHEISASEIHDALSEVGVKSC